MKNLGEHISNIRGLIKVYGRTQEGYTDEGLYSLFSVSRAEIIENLLKKFTAISEQNWLQICMKMEISKSHNCDCVPDKLECKVLKSKYKIPGTLIGRNTSKINIRLISGKVVNLVTEAEWFRRKDKETTSYFGSIVNGYLVLWNVPLNLKVILISGLWSNIMDLENIPNCSEDGTSQGMCFDPLTMPYPLEEQFAGDAYKLVMKLLGISLQVQQDLTNDSNESIKI